MNGGFLALLEEDEDDKGLEAPVPAATPASDMDDVGDDDDGGDDDGDGGADDGDDLDAEIDAELEDDDDDEEEDDENTEDEDEGHETDGGPATAATPGPSSAAPTPGAPTPAAGQESDDNKIGEEDLEDDEDMTPASATPGSVLAAPILEEMAANTGLGMGGGDLPAEMMTKAKAAQDEGAKETQMSTQDVEKMMQERQAIESKLVVHFDRHQQERYERFKRSRLNKANMKKVVDAVAGKPGVLANQNVMIALCGVTKMFVGELVEAARLVATSSNHFGPLLPVHVYEANRILQSEKKCISKPKRARLFR